MSVINCLRFLVEIFLIFGVLGETLIKLELVWWLFVSAICDEGYASLTLIWFLTALILLAHYPSFD